MPRVASRDPVGDAVRQVVDEPELGAVVLVREIAVRGLVDEQYAARLESAPNEGHDGLPFHREEVLVHRAEHDEIELSYSDGQSRAGRRCEKTDVREVAVVGDALRDLDRSRIQLHPD